MAFALETPANATHVGLERERGDGRAARERAA